MSSTDPSSVDPAPDELPANRPFAVGDGSRVVRGSAVKEFPLGDAEMLLFHEGRQVVHTLNTSAWAVWDLCDGTRTVADIARELSSAVGHPVDAVLADVHAVIGQLGTLALLELV
ncbi:MAG: PqqD family protein [Gemmatimonadetes bacterium]|nr:PqqD family protein [Gemmatimonadota bacterium]